MARWTSLLLALTIHLALYGQTVGGMVTDSATLLPVASATVTLLRQGSPTAYTHTDKDGHFALRIDQRQNGDKLQVTCLGYAPQTMPLAHEGSISIALRPSAFNLKEVQVRGARLFGRQDTISYDLTRFANSRDQTLRDVLRKLPGIDVDADGRIRYNGKALNRFTVEGLDLTGGRYAQLEERIKAKDVSRAEVIEHDQPVKALQGKVLTDAVAMNVVMKDSARDKLLTTLKPQLLVGSTVNPSGAATMIQMGKTRQCMYDVAYDRTGRDLGQETRQLTGGNIEAEEARLPAWLSVPTFEAPIDAERLRFNTSQLYGLKRISRTDDGERRVSAQYLRTVERQQVNNLSVYNLPGNPPVTTHEDRSLRLTTDELSAEAEHKVNTAQTYGTQLVRVSAAQVDALSAMGDSMRQRIKQPQVNLMGCLYHMFNVGNSQLSVQAVADYHHGVSDLSINDNLIRLRTNLWHGGLMAGWLRKKQFVTRQMILSAEVTHLHLQHNDLRLGISLTPLWTYLRNGLQLKVMPKLTYERLTRQQLTRLLPAPSIQLTQKVGHRSEWNVFAMYQEQSGSPEQWMDGRRQTDYRSYYISTGEVPLTRQLTGTLTYQYRHPVEEWFAHVSLTRSRFWDNTMVDLQITDGQYFYTRVERHNHTDMGQVEGSVSKGFYSLHLKTRLNASYQHSKGQQLSGRRLQDYATDVICLSPNIEYASAWAALSYEASLQWHHSTTGATLFNGRQQLAVTGTTGRFDLRASAVHYHNQLQSGHTLNTLLADAQAVWRGKHLRLTATLRNLFDNHSYALTRYAGVATLTDSYTLRGRELLLTAQLDL